MRPTDSVVPATACTRSGCFAPQAWPISTDAPDPRPMTKEMMKSMTGKNAEAAASALTPSPSRFPPDSTTTTNAGAPCGAAPRRRDTSTTVSIVPRRFMRPTTHDGAPGRRTRGRARTISRTGSRSHAHATPAARNRRIRRPRTTSESGVGSIKAKVAQGIGVSNQFRHLGHGHQRGPKVGRKW